MIGGEEAGEGYTNRATNNHPATPPHLLNPATPPHLLNFDGFRYGGPSGGPHHRLMVPSDVDHHGPYDAYYRR